MVMPMYNLIEYGNNYSKRSGGLQEYCSNEPNYNIENAKSFQFKVKIIGKPLDDD